MAVGQELEVLKRRASTLSLGYNLGLTALKVVAAALTGSVSLLSEAVHSGTDVVASGIAFLSVRAASAPPDEEHPYGHGKIESLAGFGEAVLLLLIMGYVVFEAIERLVHPVKVESLNLGLAVMGFSTLASLFIGRYISTIGKRAESMVLISNGRHFLIDFWTSLGVLAALVVTRVTGWHQADSVFAIGLAVWLGWSAWGMICEAFEQLIDRAVPPDELAAIETILSEEPDILNHHRLRTRHSGNEHYVDVHVVVPRDWTLVQAHDLADRVEKRIQKALAPAHVVIHVEPYEPGRMLGR